VPLTAPAVAARRSEGTRRSPFPDYRFAPNIGGNAPVYELENRALERAGHVLAAMRGLAPWDSRTIVDLGCGSGFWLPVYAAEASRVVGVEPDQVLLAAAARRTAGLPAVQAMPVVELLAGSAEHIPLPDNSADVVHARFAYFFPPGTDAGLAEVLRVLRPGGRLVAVDNDYRWGEFSRLLAASAASPPVQTAARTDAWWAARGATRHEVRSDLRFATRADLAAVLRIEFPAAVADAWLSRHPAASGLTYGYVLFAVTA
jgi:ubiquinone/menaquinone biosynthesis C-methylase UbiE